MKLKVHPRDTFGWFQTHIDQLLDSGHELILLALQIHWPHLEATIA